MSSLPKVDQIWVIKFSSGATVRVKILAVAVKEKTIIEYQVIGILSGNHFSVGETMWDYWEGDCKWTCLKKTVCQQCLKFLK